MLRLHNFPSGPSFALSQYLYTDTIGVATAVAKPSMYRKLRFVPFVVGVATLFWFQNFLRIGLSQFDKTLQSGRIDSSAQIL